jgi:Phage protein (N4 Gp49/phage Sf6 gene 66) family
LNNKITQEYLESLIDSATVEEHLFHGGKSMILSYQLESGFTIDGRAAVVDLANFDIEIGRAVAKEDAINQLWQLEGYRLQLQLAEAH